MAEQPSTPHSSADRPLREVADDAALVVGSRLLTSLIDIVTAVLLIRMLPKEHVGVATLLLVVYETAKNGAMLGFPDSVFYFFERLVPGARRAFLAQTSVLLLGTSLLAALVMFGLAWGAPTILAQWDPDSRALAVGLLPWLALVSILEIPTWPTTNLLIVAGRARRASAYQVITSLLTLAAILLPLVLGLGVQGVIFGLLSYAVLRLILSLVWVLEALPPSSAPLPESLLRQQVAFSLPLGLNTLATRINKYLDKWVIALLLPATALAEYQAGAQEIPLVTVIPYGVGSVLIARYVALQLEHRHDELRTLWRTTIEKTGLLVLPLVAAFFFAAEDFIRVLFGADYLAAVIPFQIYALLLAQRVAQYGAMLQAHADNGSILRITLWMVGANAVLSIPMTLAMGIAGAALATFLASWLAFFLYLLRIRTHLRVRLAEVFPWGLWLRTFGLAMACAGAVAALRWGPGADLPPVAGLLVLLVAAPALFLLLASLLQWVSPDDRRTLARWLRPSFYFSS